MLSALLPSGPSALATSPVPAASANGLANGHANGIPNGHANGIANGHTNGIANGHANGIVNGHAKSVINGAEAAASEDGPGAVVSAPCGKSKESQGAPERPDPASVMAAMSTSIDEKSVRAAYEDVRSDTTDTAWAVFKFQDQNIVCSETGVGFDSFRNHFSDNERAFGFIRIQMGDEMSKRQKFVFLTWVGPEVSVIRRAKMSIDKAMVKNIVKNFAVELQVESQSEINEDYLRQQLARVGGANYGTGFRD